jgi:hypothetical protein
MQKLNFRGLALSLPLGLALSLCVACGGDDDGGSKNGTGGTGGGGTSSMSNGGTSSSGSGNKAGSMSGGNASNGGSGPGGGTLPGDKTLGGLSGGELTQLCDEIEQFMTTGSFVESSQEFTCLFTGLFAAALGGAESDAELQSACKAAYDECKSAPLMPEAEECTKPDASCTATVAELRTCLADSAKAFEMAVDEFPTCSELTVDMEDPGMGTEAMDPPSCVALRDKCPELETPSAQMP